jgi:AAA+ superfamily predicted ATPase
MTNLLSAAFDVVLQAANKLKLGDGKAGRGIIFLVDEADALTQSREDGHMHHEDRAGVNAFICGVDRLSEQKVPVAVALCTNRLSAIDPAVHRRAADVFQFTRPNEAQRRAVLEAPLSEVGFSSAEINRVVEMTGPPRAGAYGYTFSDLTQRLLPTLVLDAYPDRPVTFQRAQQLIASMKSTPPFRDGAST